MPNFGEHCTDIFLDQHRNNAITIICATQTAKSHRANEEDSSRRFMAGQAATMVCEGTQRGGYTGASMYKNYNRTGLLVYENTRYMVILNRMRISLDKQLLFLIFNSQMEYAYPRM